MTYMFGWHACNSACSLNSNMWYLFTSAYTISTCHYYTILVCNPCVRTNRLQIFSSICLLVCKEEIKKMKDNMQI